MPENKSLDPARDLIELSLLKLKVSMVVKKTQKIIFKRNFFLSVKCSPLCRSQSEASSFSLIRRLSDSQLVMLPGGAGYEGQAIRLKVVAEILLLAAPTVSGQQTGHRLLLVSVLAENCMFVKTRGQNV